MCTINALCAADISIRAPARGATRATQLQCHMACDFNPRSREGSDTARHGHSGIKSISIRAPARGATDSPSPSVPGSGISIRAPARGATFSSLQNPLRSSTISIRAPARGATLRRRTNDHLGRHFNPRSREGSDFLNLRILGFQPISIRAPARGATYPEQDKKSS